MKKKTKTTLLATTTLVLCVTAPIAQVPAGSAYGRTAGPGLGNQRNTFVVTDSGGVKNLRPSGVAGLHDATAASGLAGLTNVRRALPVDFDADGREDVLFLMHDGPSLLFRATEAGVFVQTGAETGLDLDNVTEATWLDYDGDGDADLMGSSDRRARLYRNLGGFFEEVALGLDAGFLESFGPSTPPATEMGTSSCLPGINDVASLGDCLQVSTIPTLGYLYPISEDWYIDASNSYMGILNTDPQTLLDVNGVIRSRAGGLRFPDGTFQSTAVLAGPAGPAGPTGVQGAQGDQGALGAVGAQGPAGSQGLQGDTGPNGPQGLLGLTGNTGSVGPAGQNGPGLSSTQLYCVGFGDWVPTQTEGLTLAYDSGTYLTDGTYKLVGRVHLPVGATIKKITYHGNDEIAVTGLELRLQLVRNDGDNSIVFNSFIFSTSNSNGAFTGSRSGNLVVVEDADYYIRVSVQDGYSWLGGGLLSVKAALIEYEMP